ncbi:Protein CBR-SAGO-1 [Caenorhabditis briggsae]|uniref:Protein CBR-SAGO-1 n=1 Tax=Caenorhabditis briggsae TaxID=6238 RepID=A8XUC0_CAEBR|nr:Protein CBR-SAGO-1 [Caenorhabditis briggsae]CAP36245.2 Protein CBR-SAGO-1 [Caenorhabditis briggsae]
MPNVAVVEQLGALQLNENQAPMGDVPLAEKLPIGQPDGTTVKISTNMRAMILKKNTPVFKYDIKIIAYFKRDGREIAREISSSHEKGPKKENDKSACSSIYRLACDQCPELSKGFFFYDRQALLYSLSDFKKEVIETTIAGKKIEGFPNFVKAEFKITNVAESFQTSSNEIGKAVNIRPARADVTLLESLNMMASGHALENPNVFTKNNCIHYLSHPDRNIAIGEVRGQGMQASSVGATKAVRVLQGKNPTPTAYLITECKYTSGNLIDQYETFSVKTTLFHPNHAPLLNVFREIRGFATNLTATSGWAREHIQNYKGLCCYLDYGSSEGLENDRKMVKIHSFGETARNQKFEKSDGKVSSVFDYFKGRYEKILKFPDLFTVVVMGARGGRLIPVELLTFCDKQIVKTQQMEAKVQADLIKMSASKPQDRKKITNQVADSIGLGNGDGHFFTLSPPEVVEGRVLPKPVILGGGIKPNEKKSCFWNTKPEGPSTDFSIQHFSDGKSLSTWDVVFHESEPLESAVHHLIGTMTQMGMKVNAPNFVFIKNNDLRTIFDNAKKRNVELLMFITKSNREYHKEIKVLEHEFDIRTQDIRFETALKFERQQNTRRNLVNKINVKLGGINYEVESPTFTKDRIIIGLETSQNSTMGDGLICVGFSANMMAKETQFCGGYMFTQRSNDIYGSVLKDIVRDVIKQTCTHPCRVQNKPQELFFFLSGITEGQYSLINERYSNLIREGWFAAVSGGKPISFVPAITIVAVSKIHNTRRYLEGTAFTYALCYNHQIIYSPISHPVPLYMAGDMSERGSNILGFHRANYKNEELDLARINAELSYSNRKLFGTRFNA